MKKIRILLVDDHAIVRMGLASVLSTDPMLEIAGEAEDGQDALEKTKALLPDVILMDLLMPGVDGTTATALIHSRFPDVKIIILTSYGKADGIVHALASGASGALVKNIGYAALVKAIHDVFDGRKVISPEIREELKSSPPIDRLTDRQLQILQFMAQGLTDADISVQLNLSPCSVRDHLSAIYHKLGAANRTEAVAIALRKHLLKT